MKIIMLKIAIFFLLYSVYLKRTFAVTIDCQRPPQLVNPAKCCLDGGRDVVAEKCALSMGITGQYSDAPPSVETATCLAECILSESKYMIKPETLDLETIKTDLQTKFSNDTAYAKTMTEAFRKCEPNAQAKMKAFKQIPMINVALKRGCSPFAGLVLGCTYMEYFKNCPDHRWTENTECSLAKEFVMQCSLGA